MSNGDVAQKQKSSSSFHFLAGLGSGVTSAFLLQPADLLKTRVQQSKHSSLTLVLREILNGPRPIRSLWRGTVPSVVRTGAGSALYFGMLNQMRTYVSKQQATNQDSNLTNPVSNASQIRSSSLPKLSNTGNLLTGALARATAGFVLTPITVLKVRFESSYYSYPSLASAFRSILADSGPRGFLAGFGATAVRDAPYAGLYVLFYERCKTQLSGLTVLNRQKDHEGHVIGNKVTVSAAPVNFVSGIVAASAATAVTNPFDAIKTRLQLYPGRYGNLVQAARLMVAEEGVRSLFDGLALRMARKAVSSALAWTVYEELIRRAEDKIVH